MKRRKRAASNSKRAVQAYLARPYTRVLVPDSEDGGYVAEVLELPGCLSQGETPDEAYANLEEAMAGYIASSLDHGKHIPEPVGAKEYSGHFPLRISSEIHRAAALRAMQEGISLNQWVGLAIAERLAGTNLADEVVAKLKGALSVEALPVQRRRRA